MTTVSIGRARAIASGCLEDYEKMLGDINALLLWQGKDDEELDMQLKTLGGCARNGRVEYNIKGKNPQAIHCIVQDFRRAGYVTYESDFGRNLRVLAEV